MEKDGKYIAYPYLNEEGWICDYELLTDGLSSELGHAYALCKNKEIKKDIATLARIVLDFNPLIRIPNTNIEVGLDKELVTIYDKYFKEFNTFFLPISNNEFVTYLSSLRKSAKIIIRLLVKNHSNEKIIKSFNLITNIFHLIFLNHDHKKIVFKSKSYDI